MNGKKAKRLRAQLDYADERKESAETLSRAVVSRQMKLVTGRVVVVPIITQMAYPEDGVRQAYKRLKKGKENAE